MWIFRTFLKNIQKVLLLYKQALSPHDSIFVLSCGVFCVAQEKEVLYALHVRTCFCDLYFYDMIEIHKQIRCEKQNDISFMTGV